MSARLILPILRKARAGSRALDARIYLSLQDIRPYGRNANWEVVVARYEVPEYSTNIQSAMTILGPDWFWEMAIGMEKSRVLATNASIGAASHWQIAPTAALACCLAGFTILDRQATIRRAA